MGKTGTSTVTAILVTACSMTGFARADTQVIAGPALLYHTGGWSDAGLQFSVLQASTLTSFVFQNYGASDFIEVTDSSGSTVYSYEFVGSGVESSSVISVDWVLKAGETYQMVSLMPDNSKHASASYPVADDHISIVGGYGFGVRQPDYWFHFNDLTTVSAAVPESSTFGMLAFGVGVLLCTKRRACAA